MTYLTALLFKHAKDFQYSLQADLDFNESDATKGITIPFHPGACAYIRKKELQFLQKTRIKKKGKVY